MYSNQQKNQSEIINRMSNTNSVLDNDIPPGIRKEKIGPYNYSVQTGSLYTGGNKMFFKTLKAAIEYKGCE
jgi:hypothetical protein